MIDGKTTQYTYDKANQLVSSTCGEKTKYFAYDAAGRLVKEGTKSYNYSYMDKVRSVSENGAVTASFTYDVDGQIATAKTHATGKQESFLWDGLALIHRGGTSYINEPYVTGGNPILADNRILFNDMLGSTLGSHSDEGYTPVRMTAFGESDNADAFFTGKPLVGELGYTFLFRNYRPEQGKWQTTDPLGYPDGWNNLAYVNNQVNLAIDTQGAKVTYSWSGWKIDKIIGLNGVLASGYMYGDSVVVTWSNTVSWECTDCKEAGVETFYEATRYSNNDVVWSAPKAGLGISVPTATTLPG